MFILWMRFAISAAVMVFAGIRLVGLGDQLAVKTGLGRVLVGTLFIAGATSLPELVTTASASSLGAPDIALGNVLGSNNFNLLILGIIDLLQGPGPLLFEVHISQLLPGLLGILLSAIVLFWLAVGMQVGPVIHLGHLGLGSFMLVFVYIIGVRLMFGYRRKNHESDEGEIYDPLPLGQDAPEEPVQDREGWSLYLRFGMTAVLVVAAGIILAESGSGIAARTAISQTVVGTVLIAVTNSLPELVGTYGAIRIHSYDLAVGNVLGSNLFNMLLIFVADIFYVEGPILGLASQGHMLTALTAIILSCIAVIGVFYRSERSVLYLGWDSVAMIGFYLFSLAFLLFLNQG